MTFSLREFFFEKVLGTHDAPDCLDDLVDRAENLATEMHSNVGYLQSVKKDHGIFAKTATQMAVENAQGYIKKIEHDVFDLASDLKPFGKEMSSSDVHQRLKAVEDDLLQAKGVFIDFINEKSSTGFTKGRDVHLGYFSNVVKMFEPDTRPRAPVIPIRQVFDFEG